MTPPAVATIGKSSRPACVSTASGALSRVVTPGMGWNLCVGGICSGLINKNPAVDPEPARRVTVDQPVLALQRLKLPDRSLTTAAFSTSHSPSTSGPLPLFMSRMTLGEVLQLLLVPLLRPLLRRVRRELLVSLGIHEARTIWCCFLNWRCYPSDVPSGRRNSPAKTAHQALGTRRRLFSYAFRGRTNLASRRRIMRPAQAEWHRHRMILYVGVIILVLVASAPSRAQDCPIIPFSQSANCP